MEVVLWLAFVAVGFHLGYAVAALQCDVVAEVSGAAAILAVVAAVVVVVV